EAEGGEPVGLRGERGQAEVGQAGALVLGLRGPRRLLLRRPGRGRRDFFRGGQLAGAHRRNGPGNVLAGEVQRGGRGRGQQFLRRLLRGHEVKVDAGGLFLQGRLAAQTTRRLRWQHHRRRE